MKIQDLKLNPANKKLAENLELAAICQREGSQCDNDLVSLVHAYYEGLLFDNPLISPDDIVLASIIVLCLSQHEGYEPSGPVRSFVREVASNAMLTKKGVSSAE